MMYATVANHGYITSQVQFEQNLPKSALNLLLSNHRNQSGSRVSAEKVTPTPSNTFIREVSIASVHSHHGNIPCV